MEKKTNAMNLFEKIQAVSDAVRNVEKNIVVGTGNSSYKAVSDIYRNGISKRTFRGTV